MISLMRRGKEKMRACQCTKYTNKHRETCTLLISHRRNKITSSLYICTQWPTSAASLTVTIAVSGSRGLGRLLINYSCGLLHGIPPIKPCGRLRLLRFAFSMHDDSDVWAAAEPVSSSVHAPLKTWLCASHVTPRRHASSILAAMM